MPIFLIGTQRSGSTILRMILNKIPGLIAPQAPHILHRLSPLLKYYGDLSIESNFKCLIDDACTLTELNAIKWPVNSFDRNVVYERCKTNTLMAILAAIYEQLLNETGSDDWCCKGERDCLYLEKIESFFHKARYIYIYRDGRDVAASFKSAPIGEKHIYSIANQWKEDQDAIDKFSSSIDSMRFFGLSYEELTNCPIETIQRLCSFLSVEYDKILLEYYKTKEAVEVSCSSEIWKNISKPIFSGNSEKYLSQLSENEIRLFESICGRNLQDLGYRLLFPSSRIILTNDQVQEYTTLNEQMKRNRSLAHGGYDATSHLKQASLLESIKKRRCPSE